MMNGAGKQEEELGMNLGRGVNNFNIKSFFILFYLITRRQSDNEIESQA